MTRKTAQWVRKAEGNYRLAVRISRGSEPFHDQLCFHCQQSSEKYFKAYQQELGLPVPKIHDLDRLLKLLLPHDVTLKALRRGLVSLSSYAVEYRYPGRSANKRDTEVALKRATTIRKQIRKRLGLRA
ncbi:MAG TPA: HEPN domain-containing protein [Gemmataceae bacterium]|jgi:HEPN domain-containing protein|nr:HEPN domain-containing protein [Gemmataceae bacterium]